MTGGDPKGELGGYVLVGGKSSRMGRDKASLPLNDSTMAEQIASRVGEVIGHPPILIGTAARRDLIPGCGPLGGVFTALSTTRHDWNLIVACDMPDLTVEFLRHLIARRADGFDCVVPRTQAGFEPLCALYHRRCRDAAEHAIQGKLFKMQAFVSSLRTLAVPVEDPLPLRNVNTPEQWRAR